MLVLVKERSRMLIFFLIFFPQIISAAKWNVTNTFVSPRLEAINDSYVYVDYSKAFTVDFSEIKYAEFLSYQKYLNSKAVREAKQIKIVGNTIFQPLDENRKILAKLKICEEHRTYTGHQGPYVRLWRETKRETYTAADTLIDHDPLKIIADEYRNKTCYQNHNQSIFWQEEESDIVKICQPSVNIISSDESGNFTIEIYLEADKQKVLNFTSESCNKSLEAYKKTMDVQNEKYKMNEENEEKDEKKMYWIYIAVGSLSIVIIVSVSATVLVRRKKKGKKEETVIDQNIVYGSEDYYEGSDLTDKNEYYS